MRIRPLLAGAAFVSLAIPTSAAAAPVTLSCGAVLTHSVTLAGDVGCPLLVGPTLTIGAPGITLNLNGHAVYGSFGSGGIGTVAIQNSGYDDVTIRNGRISASTGVQAAGASHDLFSQLTIGGQNGISLSLGSWDTVADSTFTDRLYAVETVGSEHAQILRNHLTGGPFGGIQIRADGARVTANQDTSEGGIMVQGSSNRIARNGVGNGYPDNPAGIEVASGSANIVARNWVYSNPVGIRIDPAATQTAVRRNLSTANTGDGIYAGNATTRLFENVAEYNGGYGIEAIPGVFGFGNTASANAKTPQCLNITCS